DVQPRLDAERRASQAREIALFGAHERILAASLEGPLESLPSQPPGDLVRQVEQRRTYVTLQPHAGGHYLSPPAAAPGGAEASHSQQAVERERQRLAIILARLSTGVLAVDRSLTVRTANEAAGAILGTDLSAASGRSLPELAAGNERLGQFVAALAVRFAAGREEWREQLELDGAAGRRTLMCTCTPLPGEDSDV